MRRMLITLMFSVVAVKSRTFFQLLIFRCSAGVQELRGSAARQIAKLGSRSILYYRRHAQFMNGGGRGAESYQLFGFQMVPILSGLGVQTFPRVCPFWGIL